MTTREMLEKINGKHRDYLNTLKADIKIAEGRGYDSLVKEYKAVARGYIRCLVECGVIDNFKTAWCWFTV